MTPQHESNDKASNLVIGLGDTYPVHTDVCSMSSSYSVAMD